MTRAGPITDLVVVGGGIVGRSAAAAMKRRHPRMAVTLVDIPPPPDALADRLGPTLPSINGFHGDLGLAESDTVVRVGSAFRLGICFEGWGGAGTAYSHCYGKHGQPFGTVSFHHHWVRAAHDGEAGPFDAYSPAAAMAGAGRFVHPQGGDDSPLGTFEYGLHLDNPRYLDLLRAYGRHLGIVERSGDVAEVRLDPEDGFIAALRLDDGSEVSGHLFLDCTGPAARLRTAMDDRFDDWTRWLPCDRILLSEAPASGEPPLLDRVTATASGWRWEAFGLARTSRGHVFSSAYPHEADGELVPIRSGRRPDPWLRNCVVLGDAAVCVEPLEWTNLHLAHSAIDRIAAMMPDRACAPIELGEYNRQCEAEADRIRDFLALHYVTARRPGDAFWRDAAAAEPPASLADTLSLFAERGRLPFYEEETFARDSWLAVLLGQGVIPRRVDPLTGSVPLPAAEAAMARMRAGIGQLTASLPSHGTYLNAMAARTRR